MRDAAGCLQGLRKFLKDDHARFKSEHQAKSVQLTLKREHDLLVILPTGGGKSLVFQLPVFMERKMVTVVIIPFVALLEEMKEKCEKLGLDAQIWTDEIGLDLLESSGLIFVGIEHAVRPSFQQLLVQLEGSKRLSRLVFDECHTIYSQKSFRPIMRRLGSLIRCVSVPVILLSASLPKEMENELTKTLGLEELVILRTCTDRLELEYKVVDVSDSVSTMRELNWEIGNAFVMATKEWNMKKTDRVIIYCLQTNWAEELAKYLNEKLNKEFSGVYHAKLTVEERRENLSRWKSGRYKCLCATGALGTGLDYSSVRFVIHQGFARSQVDFVQEVGRAGRDGQRAKAITIFWDGLIKEVKDWINEDDMNKVLEWIGTSECKRKELGIYCDGKGRDCLSLQDAELCCNCLKVLREATEMELESIGTGIKRGRGNELEEIKEGQDLKNMLQGLKGTCVFCWTNKKDEWKNHKFGQCK